MPLFFLAFFFFSARGLVCTGGRGTGDGLFRTGSTTGTELGSLSSPDAGEISSYSCNAAILIFGTSFLAVFLDLFFFLWDFFVFTRVGFEVEPR